MTTQLKASMPHRPTKAEFFHSHVYNLTWACPHLPPTHTLTHTNHPFPKDPLRLGFPEDQSTPSPEVMEGIKDQTATSLSGFQAPRPLPLVGPGVACPTAHPKLTQLSTRKAPLTSHPLGFLGCPTIALTQTIQPMLWSHQGILIKSRTQLQQTLLCCAAGMCPAQLTAIQLDVFLILLAQLSPVAILILAMTAEIVWEIAEIVAEVVWELAAQEEVVVVAVVVDSCLA